MAQPAAAAARTRSPASSRIQSLERELLLLGRHSALVAADAVSPRLERSAYLLLTRLELSGELTLKELADALRLDVSTVNRQCASLLRQNLAERIPAGDDTIARRYRPTAHGLALLHSDRDDRLAGVATVVAGWSEQETAQLVESLRRFNESIERQQCLEWPR